MLNLFKNDSRVATRALQAYLILIGLARNRQTTTYGRLSDYMEFGKGGILAEPLGCVMGWCHFHGLPPLTSIVVNDSTGLPGEGLGLNPADFPSLVLDVFDQDWFAFMPPSVDELAAALLRVKAGQVV